MTTSLVKKFRDCTAKANRQNSYSRRSLCSRVTSLRCVEGFQDLDAATVRKALPCSYNHK